MAVVEMGNKFPTELVTEMFNTVRGESALAKLAPSMPVPFVGATQMVFSMDSEASIVGEGEAKVHGGAKVEPKIVRPYTFEYGARFSKQMWKAGEEQQLQILRQFVEGAARKFAKGMDIGAMHGLNPASMTDSTVVNGNCFETVVTNSTPYVAASADENIGTAVALVEGNEITPNGIAMAPAMKNAIGAIKVNGAVAYPAFMWGGAPEDLGGKRLTVNPTISAHKSGAATTLYGLVGDFSAFKWGYVDNIEYEVIEYGDPDNTGVDLAGHNQIYLRAEAYIGWAILDKDFFAKIEA